MKKKIVLVDFSNMAHTCWHPALAAENAGKKALAEHLKIHPTELVEQADLHGADCCGEVPKQYDAKLVLHTNLEFKLETLKRVLGVDPNGFVFVEDDHAVEKYRIFPGYKGTRDREAFDPRPLAKHYIRKSLAPRADWLRSPQHEADDALATAAVFNRGEDKEVIVVSGDKDLWALLQLEGVSVYSSAHKAFITPEHIAKAFNGLRDPKYIALHKALWGDSSDNVPNAVPRMQKSLLPSIQASDGTLFDFLEKTGQFDLSDKCTQLLQENLRQVVINDRLVRLRMDVPLTIEPTAPSLLA